MPFKTDTSSPPSRSPLVNGQAKTALATKRPHYPGMTRCELRKRAQLDKARQKKKNRLTVNWGVCGHIGRRTLFSNRGRGPFFPF
jgi:hypothetical protein